MKKISLFAIVMLTVMMVACNNKSNASADAEAGTNQLPEGFVHYDGACYAFDCPEALSNGRMGDTIFLSNAPAQNASLHVNMMTEDVPTAEEFQKFADKKIAERKRYMEILQDPKIEDKLLSIRCKDEDRGEIVEFFYVLGESGNMAYGNFSYKEDAANEYEAAVEPFVNSIVVK